MKRRFTAPELILLVVGVMIVLWLIGMPLVFHGVALPENRGIFGTNLSLNGFMKNLNPWTMIVVALAVFAMVLLFGWDFGVPREEIPPRRAVRTVRFLKFFSLLLLVIAVIVTFAWKPYVQFKSKGRWKINGTPAWTR
jgi:hypothetical protein